MQTRKKLLAKNSAREPVDSKIRRQLKDTSVTERKVTELITSASAKKRKNAKILSSKSRDAESAKNLSSSFILSPDEPQNVSMSYEPTLDHKTLDNSADQCMETIFSPSFHLRKDLCGRDPEKGFFASKEQGYCQDNNVEKSNTDSSQFRLTIEEQVNIKTRSEIGSTWKYDKFTESINGSSYTSDLQNNEPNGSIMEFRQVNSSCDEEFKDLGNLSSEVSAIYLAMQHSKLECIDEQNQDSISAEECVENGEDEFDDFDPYLFIKHLPDLSNVVPTFRPMLLPKQTRSCPSTTLVLDLDETLVHSTLEPCEDVDFTFSVKFNLKDHTVYVRCRPYLKDFMERVASQFEIIIFTASQSIYAEQLLNVLDPKRKLFRHRVYRESCVYVEGNYLKDLSVLGRDLAQVIIIDNSPQAFGFQIDNGIPIESWFDDRSDQELLSLLPFLDSLVGVKDVRPLIADRFNLREKIAATSFPPTNLRR